MFELWVRNAFDVMVKIATYKRECNAVKAGHKTFIGFHCEIREVK
jgi:hypothetical protein